MKLFQWRQVVKSICKICIENGTVVLSHLQCGMSQELLQSEGIPAAIQKILPGKGVPKHMDRGFLYPSLTIVAGNGEAKGVFCQHFTVFIAKQVFGGGASPYLDIVLQMSRQGRAERDDLDLACLGVPEYDLAGFQVYIPV